MEIGDSKEDVINAFYHEKDLVVQSEYETDIYRFDNEGYVGHIITKDNGFERIEYYENSIAFFIDLSAEGTIVMMDLVRAHDGY